MSREADLDLAVVGNCTWAGLIDDRARLVWACLPRFDSDPVFSSLLAGEDDDEGVFAIDLVDLAESERSYDANTAILRTILRDRHGGAIEVRDFAPRFANYGRTYRPTMLMRKVIPIAGEPRIRVVLRPTGGYGRESAQTTRGSNHIRYITPGITLRLTTDAPISYVADATPFVVGQPIHLILGPDETWRGPIVGTFEEYEERTREHWVEWVRGLSIPFEWQEAVIRAAITLQLCYFEETGAIVAALTTSIPEHAHSERNWDYRFCWLRDAYFVVHALNRLGATGTMEGYLGYLTNLVAGAGPDGGLQPVYGIGLEQALIERTEDSLAGYRGMGPVRVGNQAYEHIQNDVYGSAVLAATQSFFDARLLKPGGERLFRLLEVVGDHAVRVWDQPDAGLWELRTRASVHTFSAVMCWAACDRLARIGERIGLTDRAAHWRRRADEMHSTIEQRSDRKGEYFSASFENAHADASLLLLEQLGFVAADDPRYRGTVAMIEQDLRRGPYLYRYSVADDFGTPETAFNICTFWYIDALAACGRTDEARELFENMLARRNSVGLLSEDLDPHTGELWGNFPQTYSMVGLINSAMRLSRSWEDAF
ncbi:MAG: glycoside hydrolase family 15 protein [Deltaproteobacteria bacterium]|jgi:pentatricopeptide repeat protein|nr:glycoside hydrolase family 15 protein [Deltaproteobacteria bacterium]